MRLVAGAAVLGKWSYYKPAFYRVYYEACCGSDVCERESVPVVSRLGFLGLAAGLSEVLDAEKVAVALIAPVTLATLNGDVNNVYMRLTIDWPRGFTSFIMEGVRAATSIREDKNLINHIQTVAGSAGRVIVVKELRIDCEQSCLGEKGLLPGWCSYKGSLSYDVYTVNTGNRSVKSIKRDKDIVVSIIAIPLHMAARVGETLVVFREGNVHELDMHSAMRASILAGLTEALLPEVLVDDEVDAMFFYDVTHGANIVLSAFTHALETFDSVLLLRVAAKVLKEAAEGHEAAYMIRSYLYNSDPIALGKGDDRRYLELTAGNNLSYYYQVFTPSITLSSKPGVYSNDSKSVKRLLRGMAPAAVRIRKLLGELVSKLQEGLNTASESPEETRAARLLVDHLLLASLVRLGMLHWAIAQLRAMEQGSAPSRLSVVKFKVSDTCKYVAIRYKPIHAYGKQPYIYVAGLELGSSLADYLDGLYKAVRRVMKGEGVANAGSVCLTLNVLKLLVEPLEEKMSILRQKRPENNGDGGENAEGLLKIIIATSTLYSNMVEPGFRLLILNELERIKNDTEKFIDHFLPRGFQLASARCGEDEFGEDKPTCIYPMSEQRLTDKNVRNFIAHGGLTRLSRDWCVSLKRGEENKCVPYMICIEKPLSRDKLLRILAQTQHYHYRV